MVSVLSQMLLPLLAFQTLHGKNININLASWATSFL